MIVREPNYRFGDDSSDSDFTPTDSQTTNLLNLDNSSQDNFTPTQQQQDNLLGVPSTLQSDGTATPTTLSYATSTDSGAGSSATDNILGGATYSLSDSSGSSNPFSAKDVTGALSALAGLFKGGQTAGAAASSLLTNPAAWAMLGGGLLLVVVVVKTVRARDAD